MSPSPESRRHCRQATKSQILHSAQRGTLYTAVQDSRESAGGTTETARSSPVPHDHCRSTEPRIPACAARTAQDHFVPRVQGNARGGIALNGCSIQMISFRTENQWIMSTGLSHNQWYRGQCQCPSDSGSPWQYFLYLAHAFCK